jgi:predicted HTH transcriptional regulator
MGNPSRARTVAETRARATLARELSTIVEQRIDDVGSGVDMDISAIREAQRIVTNIIINQELRGAYIWDESLNGNTSYVLVKLPEDRIGENIELARSAAVRQVQEDSSARVTLDDLNLLMRRVIGSFL